MEHSLCPGTEFKDILVHTAKCSKCNHRNSSILKQCKTCPAQLCETCFSAFDPTAPGKHQRIGLGFGSLASLTAQTRSLATSSPAPASSSPTALQLPGSSPAAAPLAAATSASVIHLATPTPTPRKASKRKQKRRHRDTSEADSDTDSDYPEYAHQVTINNETTGERLCSPRRTNRRQRKSTASSAMPPVTPSPALEREARQDVLKIRIGPNKKPRISSPSLPASLPAPDNFPTSATRNDPPSSRPQISTEQNNLASIVPATSSTAQGSQNIDATRETPQSKMRRLIENYQRRRPTSTSILAGLELDAIYSHNRALQLMSFVQAQRAANASSNDPSLEADNNDRVPRPARHNRLAVHAAREAAMRPLEDMIRQSLLLNTEYERALEAEEREENYFRAQAPGNMVHYRSEGAAEREVRRQEHHAAALGFENLGAGPGPIADTGAEPEQGGDPDRMWHESLEQAASDAMSEWESMTPSEQA